MATSDDTRSTVPARDLVRKAASLPGSIDSPSSPSSPNSPGSGSKPPPYFPPAQCQLEQLIETERRRILQAHAVLKCLSDVRLCAEDEDAVTHAEAAYVAAELLDGIAERLDLVRLRPLIEHEIRARSRVAPE